MAEDFTPFLIGGALAAAAIGIGAAVVLAQPPPPPPPPGGIGTGLSLAITPNPAPVNQPVAVTGRLIRVDTSVGLPSQTILIETSTDQLVWLQVTSALTGNDGSYGAQLTFTAPGTYYIRARFAGA